MYTLKPHLWREAAIWDIGLKLHNLSQVADFTAKVRKAVLEAPTNEGDPPFTEPTPRLRPLSGLRMALRPFLVHSSMAALSLQTLHALLPFNRKSWYSSLTVGLAVRLLYETLVTGTERERLAYSCDC